MTYELLGAFSETSVNPGGSQKSVSASLVTHLARHWIGKLAHNGTHRNDEHCLALLEEAVR